MERDERVQEYLESAEKWLLAAKSLPKESSEPAAFNALHAVELAAKAALIAETGGEYKTHNIGGEFGKHFKVKAGKDICRELNKKMMEYNKIRYPEEHVEENEAKEIVSFSTNFLETVKNLIEDLNIDSD
ncbi:MAG: HEPN domain-containing protein [Candidatus Aenigmatarchaeota archaeon]